MDVDYDQQRPTTRAGSSNTDASSLVFNSGSQLPQQQQQQQQPVSRRSRTRGGLMGGGLGTTTTIEEEGEGEWYESEEEEDVFAFGPPGTAEQVLDSHPQQQQLEQQPHQSETAPILPPQIVYGLPQPSLIPSPDPTSSTTFFFSPPPLPPSESDHNHSMKPPPPSSTLLPVESPPQTDSTTSSFPQPLPNNSQSYRMRPISLSVPKTAQTSTKKSSVTANEQEREIYTATSMPYTTTDGMSGVSMSGASTTEGNGSIKMEFDFDNLGIGGDDEEDSPYPEVRASVSNIDDPSMPSLTIRMWVIGMGLSLIMCAINIFFNLRNPGPTIPPLVTLLLSYPLGKFMAYSLPINTYKVPEIKLDSIPVLRRWSRMRGKVLGGWEWSLNPGPWNIKEHVLVYMMANVSINPPYAMNMILVSEINYNQYRGFGFNLLLVFATQLTGFGLAGMCRRFLVWPASMVWPQNLVVCTLLNTLHAEDDAIMPAGMGVSSVIVLYRKGILGIWDRIVRTLSTTHLSRYRFFTIVGICSFFWFFFPNFLWMGLSLFGWACWIAPNNIVVNQLFGVSSGLGMGILTFDWTEIAWLSSPLAVPWWAQCHVFLGFVLVYWILTPILYYTNVWNLSYFPLTSSLFVPYDNQAKVYNVTRILTTDNKFNVTAYDDYSPLYLPASFAMTYLLAFCLSTCVLVHTVLYHGRSLINGAKKIRIEPDDIHAKLMKNYPEVPDWWYFTVFVGFFGMAIILVEHWHTGVPVYMIMLAVLLPVIYVIPSGFIFAMTAQSINLNLIAQIIPGAILPGDPLVNMLFKSYSIQTLGEALSFSQDLKLGHYIKVPPRATFTVQLVACGIAGVVQIGVKEWLFANVPGICKDGQPSQLTCPHNRVFFTASAVWGIIGPSRQFGTSSIYHPQLYALLVGVFLPIPFWLWQRRYPNTRLKYVNMPVLVNGVGYIPPATGINYSSWFATGFVFQYLIRKRNFAWWSKYNYVMSAGLDCGTLFCALFIFFALTLPFKSSIAPKWWGNQVFRNTADFKALPFRQVPPGGIPSS